MGRGTSRIFRGKTALLALDLHKAFDVVAVATIIESIQSSVPILFVRHIMLLLTGRRVKVTTQAGNSRWHRQVLGLTQGSLIGPTLWLHAVNSLLVAVESAHGVPHAFADDITIEVRGFTLAELTSQSRRIMEAVTSWSSSRSQPVSSKSSVLLCTMNPHEHGARLAIPFGDSSSCIRREYLGDASTLPSSWTWWDDIVVEQFGDLFYQVLAINEEQFTSRSSALEAWRRATPAVVTLSSYVAAMFLSQALGHSHRTAA